MKRILSLLLVALMALSVCGVAVADTEKVVKLQWFQAIGIDSLFEDPWHDRQSLYPDMVFEGLTAVDALTGEVVPVLATEWVREDDGLSYTFTIRDGVKWHDGEPLTAEDVYFTFNLEAGNPAGLSALIKNIEGYEAVANGETDTLSGVILDGNKVTFKLLNKDSLFLASLGSYAILPKHLLEGVAPADLDSYEAYWTKPIGCGPFMIDEVSFPDYFTVVAFDDYWGAKPGFEKAQFVNYNAGGNDAVVAAMISGDLDYAYGNAVNDMAVAQNVVNQNSDVEIIMVAGTYTRMFAFNIDQRADGNNKEDLKKPEVRQAFNLIMDKNAIASFYGDQAVALSTLCNPGSIQYNDDIPLPYQDIDTAVQMLKDADFDFDQTIKIDYYYDDQTTHDIMAFIEQSFEQAGVKVEMHLMTGDLSTLIYTDANYDMLYLAGGSSRPCDMYYQLTDLASYSFIGDNEVKQPMFNELLYAYRATEDAVEAKELANQLQAVGYEQCYIIPVYGLNSVTMYNAAHVEVPVEYLEQSIPGFKQPRFDLWSVK